MTELHQRIRRLLLAGAIGTALALAGCAGAAAPSPEAGPATSGVTVYGTVDAGIGRTAR
jgi:hypothetical protein